MFRFLPRSLAEPFFPINIHYNPVRSAADKDETSNLIRPGGAGFGRSRKTPPSRTILYHSCL